MVRRRDANYLPSLQGGLLSSRWSASSPGCEFTESTWRPTLAWGFICFYLLVACWHLGVSGRISGIGFPVTPSWVTSWEDASWPWVL